MNLFLLRHGIAVERGDLDYQNDAARPLTPKGRRQLRQVAAAVRALELRFDAVWSSPLVRARQTGEIMSRKFKAGLVFAGELKPGGDPRKLIRKISRQKPVPENLLLVGHEPDLSELISLLVAGRPGAGFALKKGGMARLEIEALQAGKCATLAWLLAPAQLRLMV